MNTILLEFYYVANRTNRIPIDRIPPPYRDVIKDRLAKEDEDGSAED